MGPGSAPLLLLLVAAGCLLSSTQAKPLGAEYTYKCCRESLLADSSQFKPATGVTTLEACKAFCKSNDYGSPIYGVGGWQCTTSKSFLCREVDRALCPDDITQSQGYYRFYPTSSLVRITDSTSRNLTSVNASRLDIDDISSGDIRRIILGGRTVGDFRARELGAVRVQHSGSIITTTDSDLVRTANFEGNININDLGGVLRATGTGSISIETTRSLVGGNRTVLDANERAGRTTSSTVQDLSRDGNSDLFRRESGLEDSIVRRGTGREQRSGESNTTSVTVSGGSLLNTEAFFGAAPSISDNFRGANTNLTATRSHANENVLTDAVGTIARAANSRDTSVRLIQGRDGSGLLRRTSINGTSTNSREFTRAGDLQLGSERKVLEKDDFGVIDQTTNSSTGSVTSVADLRGTSDELRLVNTTRECPTCISQNNEAVRRQSITVGAERANSQSRQTAVNTVTRADGRELVARGTTGTETNTTRLDSNTDGVARHVITDQAEADCDRSKGTCAQSLNTSRVRLVNSSNSTNSEDVQETKKSTIFIGNY